MTQKYLLVRMAIYDTHPTNLLNTTRTTKDMKKLFTPLSWVIVLSIVILWLISLVAFIVYLIHPEQPWFLIPYFLLVALALSAEHLPASILYRSNARNKELKN